MVCTRKEHLIHPNHVFLICNTVFYAKKVYLKAYQKGKYSEYRHASKYLDVGTNGFPSPSIFHI